MYFEFNATEKVIHKFTDERIKHGTWETLSAITKGTEITKNRAKQNRARAPDMRGAKIPLRMRRKFKFCTRPINLEVKVYQTEIVLLQVIKLVAEGR